MKHLFLLLVAVFGLHVPTTFAQAKTSSVSKELAQQRSSTISDVVYDLTFNIPSDEKSNVTGTAVITFTLTEKIDVLLDFQGKFSGACLINKRKRVAETANGHIVIPQRLLKSGKNILEMNFVSQATCFSRQADYIFTQFGADKARNCFPCFDQPDIRARFTAHLNLPEGWNAIVNDGLASIPTYKFSFIAGKFNEATAKREGYPIRVLYRDADADKTAQFDKIFDEIGQSIRWMEGYTGLKYPFKEYGLVILPGYQVGDIEHSGTIQLNSRRLFLANHPSQDERLNRAELIAHATAHQWFGNLVSTKSHEEEWTKEVLASFMASKITRRQFSNSDHSLNFLRTYQARAMAIDRTEGTHPIAQPLDGLSHTGLMYDAIIYDKAPVVMRIMEQLLTPPVLQAGLQKYLNKYYYNSASWDDLIDILDAEAPGFGVRQFSDVWIKQKGMPTIHTTYQDGKLIVSQTDPFGRGLCWRQKFDIRLIYDMDRSRTVTVDMQQPTVSVPMKQRPSTIIPNYDGRGYGRFTLDEEYTKKLPLRLITTKNDLQRYALMLTLFDNYLMGRIPASYFGELYRNMLKEKNPLNMQTAVSHMMKIAFDQDASSRKTLEQCITDIAADNKMPECRQAIMRMMSVCGSAPDVMRQLENVWKKHNDPLFDEHDYMEMAYRLAITNPTRWKEIINEERKRLKSEDLINEFDYVSRACNPDVKAQTDLFNKLLVPENRTHEAWVIHTVALLNADVREPQNNAFISTTLNNLQKLQETSDMFFAGNWVRAAITQHKSDAAKKSIEQFLKTDTKCPQNLKNKVREAAWPLLKQQYYVDKRPAKVITNPAPAKKTGAKRGTAKKVVKK